jgi:hypothetical protein
MASGLANASSIIVLCTPSVNQKTELDNTISCTGLAGTGITASEVTGITLEIFGSVDNPPSSLSLTNNDTAAAHSGYAFTDSEFDITGVPTGVTLPTDSLGNTFGVLAGTCSPLTSSCVTLAAGATTTIGVSGTGNTGALSVASADLGTYEGTVSFLGTTSTSLNVNFGGGNVTASQTTTDDFSAQEVISYTVPGGVPEPATSALIGGALLGLSLVRKRLKKS